MISGNGQPGPMLVAGDSPVSAEAHQSVAFFNRWKAGKWATSRDGVGGRRSTDRTGRANTTAGAGKGRRFVHAQVG